MEELKRQNAQLQAHGQMLQQGIATSRCFVVFLYPSTNRNRDVSVGSLGANN
jgi:hypothetical protein